MKKDEILAGACREWSISDLRRSEDGSKKNEWDLGLCMFVLVQSAVEGELCRL